jgi:antitoxin YefM
MITKRLPLAEAKRRFIELVKDVETFSNHYFITSNGKDSVVLLPVKEFESIVETLDILSNKKEVRAITEGASQVKRGETVSLSKYLSSKKK